MDELQCKVAVGAMLHDIGKVLYRSSDRRKHSRSGHDFLRDEVGLNDRDILEQVLYHHADMLRGSHIANDSLAYITYMADNIASAADRREKDVKDTDGFDRAVPLESIFNILNENHSKMHYFPSTMDKDGKINYPTDKQISFDSSFYGKIEREIKDTLKGLVKDGKVDEEYLNSLLSTLEAYLTYIPSSTDLSQQTDVSLFDHMKLTAALASCILIWLRAEGVQDYKRELFTGAKDFYAKKIFYIFSMDISGIQAFIYHQYDTGDVLKNLRARSFYLEVMLENFVDTLLRMEGLSRANLLYSGGGHAYLILPNTTQSREVAQSFAERTNAWLQETYGTDLFLGTGGVACSSHELENEPEGSYGAIFRSLSRKVSHSKSHRYTGQQIIQLNQGKKRDGSRECRICHRSDLLTEDKLCTVCSGLAKLSSKIMDQDKKFFAITGSYEKETKMPIYQNEYLMATDMRKVRAMMLEDKKFVSVYSKNEFHSGCEYATNLWVADYSSARTLQELVDKGKGISRLGVIRADVDNLGKAFVSGFPQKYQTLSRAATFSRTLSMFFKWHVNGLLANGGYRLEDGGEDICAVSSIEHGPQKKGIGPRAATVIYAGGDDLFIVGAWKDILEFAVDLHRSLKKFSIDTLRISAGIGMYDVKYPISYIASQSGDLESASKNLEEKNAVTIFSDVDQTYHWDEFIDKVLGEKFRLLYKFFFSLETQERGNSFLYRILELFRKSDEKINLARLAYLLARLEPSKKGGTKATEAYELYKEFRDKLYRWQRNEIDRKQFITAIYIYAYLIRKED